jgi:hypothetical protein
MKNRRTETPPPGKIEPRFQILSAAPGYRPSAREN